MLVGLVVHRPAIFLRQGYHVYGVDKSDKPDLNGNFHFIKLDLSSELSPLFKVVPSVDILCNTAGILDAYKPLLDVSDEEVEHLFDINFYDGEVNTSLS